MCMEEPKNFHFSSPHDLLRKDLHFITYDVSMYFQKLRYWG
jgi:hypothetical protein